MNRSKSQAEHILWRAAMHISHVRDGVWGNESVPKSTRREARQAHDFLTLHRAKLIVGDKREPVAISRTVFTYWRNRPRATDSRVVSA